MSGMTFRPVVYLLIIVACLAGGLLVSQRLTGVLSCQADGYGGGTTYLAYCGGTHYGDFDHGAFWFDLEPAARDNARRADALFLGNSRMQVAFASATTSEWFASASRSHYLLGFTYDEAMVFAGKILQKLQPQAKLYVINLDHFFQDRSSEPAQAVASDPQARARYRDKRNWQAIHRLACGPLARLCGNQTAWFRSVENGGYVLKGKGLIPGDISGAEPADDGEVSREVALAQQFLDDLGVPRSCVVFTVVPYDGAPTAAGQAIAAALNVGFVAPQIEGLRTIDGSHLDAPSVARWSTDFFRIAEPMFKACLDGATNTP
jgi:hypothetical protein